ncbi:hypothetical protein ACFL9T_23155, partial [Thermodesulfobacteriota bacterium]
IMLRKLQFNNFQVEYLSIQRITASKRSFLNTAESAILYALVEILMPGHPIHTVFLAKEMYGQLKSP